ncbi:M23 family metallopeptidase [Streptomyces sp. A7024]|uniref:M23 family metallopeptidase n=2 Tax=Streptomyces coryli TaxID=1128680 RepID=A0A6G4TZK9_9ACTN|nr:M23 family metallopeptidase [Streptomyces coryli]
MGFGLLDAVKEASYGRWVQLTATVLWGSLMVEFVFDLIGGARRRKAPADDAEPVTVAAPVRGRWKAHNSPADKVPSHGTHHLGQTYAIDIVRVPEDTGSPAFGWWPVFRRNEDFPAYGSPILAPGAGTVVSAVDWRRDHRARNSWPALVYFMVVEQIARSMGPKSGILGNFVTVELDGGSASGSPVYALYAHLKRGSVAVRPGDRVTAGQQLAECGNTGNSTEPHLHFQLMDAADPDAAKGVPFAWEGVGVPANGEHFAVANQSTAA